MIFFLLLAVVGFCLSVVVHFSTFGNVPVVMAKAWPLHIGIFAVFLPMIIAQNRWGRSAPGRKRTFAEQFPNAPTWAHLLGKVCIAYVIVNFGLFMLYSVRGDQEGKMSTQNGRHVLMKNRQVVREVGEDEYRYHEARVARGFSGHWLLFYGVAAIGLYDAMQRKRRQEELGGSRATAANVLPAKPPYPGRSPTLGLFAHSIAARFVPMVGFLGGPLCMAFLVLPHMRRSSDHWGCCFVPAFFGSGIAGLMVVGLVFQSCVAARCPSCGGRAYGSERSREEGGGWRYKCRDCGEEHFVN